MIDEVEQPGVGPVDVLEHEDQRVARRHPFEEPSPGVEQLLTTERVVAAAPTSARIWGATEFTEQLVDRVLGLPATTSVGSSSRISHCALIASASAEYAGVPVREAAAAAPVDELGQPSTYAELARQPGLADAGRAHDRHERGPALGLDAVDVSQDRELLVSPDQRA